MRLDLPCLMGTLILASGGAVWESADHGPPMEASAPVGARLVKTPDDSSPPQALGRREAEAAPVTPEGAGARPVDDEASSRISGGTLLIGGCGGSTPRLFTPTVGTMSQRTTGACIALVGLAVLGVGGARRFFAARSRRAPPRPHVATPAA